MWCRCGTFAGSASSSVMYYSLDPIDEDAVFSVEPLWRDYNPWDGAWEPVQDAFQERAFYLVGTSFKTSPIRSAIRNMQWSHFPDRNVGSSTRVMGATSAFQHSGNRMCIFVAGMTCFLLTTVGSILYLVYGYYDYGLGGGDTTAEDTEDYHYITFPVLMSTASYSIPSIVTTKATVTAGMMSTKTPTTSRVTTAVGTTSTEAPTTGTVTTMSTTIITTSSRTTRTTAATTTRSPLVLPEKPLLCLIRNHAFRNVSFPQDGLCNFIILSVKMQGNEVVYAGKGVLPGAMPIKSYYDAAVNYKQTGCGISFSTDIVGATEKLRRDATPLLTVWNNNVRTYAAMETLFYPGAVDTSVNEAIDILKECRKLQLESKSPNTPAFIFVGATFWLQGGKIEEPEYISRFNDLLREVKPYAVILVTTFLGRNPLGCLISGPNLWPKDPTRGQPTFENILELRRSLAIPGQVRQLLTLSLFGIAYTKHVNQTFVVSDRQGAVCNDSYLISQAKHCVIEATDFVKKDIALQQNYMLKKAINTMYVFDTTETLEKKICLSAIQYNFTGGYAMYSMELSDYGNVCADQKYGGDYAVVHYVKEFLGKDYKYC